MSEKFMVVDEQTGGRKENDATQPALIPPLALLELGRLYAKGAEKYEPWNWAKGYDYSLALNALLRHAYKYMAGEDTDPENGCHHMAAVAFHALSLIHFDGTGIGNDDRHVHHFTGESKHARRLREYIQGWDGLEEDDPEPEPIDLEAEDLHTVQEPAVHFARNSYLQGLQNWFRDIWDTGVEEHVTQHEAILNQNPNPDPERFGRLWEDIFLPPPDHGYRTHDQPFPAAGNPMTREEFLNGGEEHHISEYLPHGAWIVDGEGRVHRIG